MIASTELSSPNSTARIRLTNLLGSSETSTARIVETIEFVEMPKPDVHVVTILAILFSAILLCVIIVISLRKLGDQVATLHHRESTDESRIVESMENPTLEKESSFDEDAREVHDVDVSDGGTTSGGAAGRKLASGSETIVKISDDESDGDGHHEIRKTRAPPLTKTGGGSSKRKVANTGAATTSSDMPKSYTNPVSLSTANKLTTKTTTTTDDTENVTKIMQSFV